MLYLPFATTEQTKNAVYAKAVELRLNVERSGMK